MFSRVNFVRNYIFAGNVDFKGRLNDWEQGVGVKKKEKGRERKKQGKTEKRDGWCGEGVVHEEHWASRGKVARERGMEGGSKGGSY